jgi:2-polyprenyl-3-methyl-5-hydroxy-6-metoxy-1,4-benzoquinol methylase
MSLNTVRHYSTSFDGIQKDHLNRYHYAIDTLDRHSITGPVLDAACGCGYGASLIHKSGRQVQAVDISDHATSWGDEYFNGPTFTTGDLSNFYPLFDFDAVVSLETIEHLPNPVEVLKRFRSLTKGILIASVPNEELYKFDPSLFVKDEYPHLRHYTPDEFEELLACTGWEVIERNCQTSKSEPLVRKGTNGRFLVYVAK